MTNVDPMRKRLGMLGLFLVVVGLGFGVAAGVAYARVQDGYGSLQAFSEAQNVQLTYDDEGNLTDRGSTDEADAIMSLLTDDWDYPVVKGDLDPDDPLVNTATEYMYQMATVTYHTLHSTQTVVLPEAVTADDGTVYPAGEYAFDVDGRYWTDFDRSNPIEAAARDQAWTGTAHALVGELGVGTVTHSALQLGLAMAGVLAGLGLVFLVTGGGMIWAGRGRRGELTVPDTIPDALLVEQTGTATKI